MRSFSSPTNINLEAIRGRFPWFAFGRALYFRVIGFGSLTDVSIIVPGKGCEHRHDLVSATACLFSITDLESGTAHRRGGNVNCNFQKGGYLLFRYK